MYKKLIYLISFALVLALALSSTTSAELVGWWKFDETSGAIAADSSGNGNDGTLYGDPQWVAGWIDGGLQLDGEDDYVELPIGSLIPTLEETTLTIWVNWLGGDPWQRIIDFGTGTGNYIYLTPSAATFANSLHVAITNGAGWDEFSSGKGTLPIGDWHHIAIAVSDSNGTIAMYLDGELVGSMDGAVNTVSGLGETNQNWLGRSQYPADDTLNGILDDFRIYNHVLSEFGLHAIAVTNFRKAWKPRPADGQVDVLLDQKLIWNQGIISDETFELYNEHNVYFGTDFNDVNSATEPTVIVTDENEYATHLDYDTMYYWRVDEVSSLDPNNPVRGDVWSFTAANFVVVEDFEDYNDYAPDEVWNTWIDGFDDPANGSTAGYPNPAFFSGEHYMEDEIVHGGNWSMPLFYDNSEAGLSEVTRTFNADWTQEDVVTLTLFYYGEAGNVAEPMYVALNGNAVVTNDDPKAALDNEWNQWDILLQEFADQGVNLTNVNTMSIGFGNKANPQPGGGTGHVFFDDIRLYRSLPEEAEPEPEPVDPGTGNLMAYYAFENNTQDGSGNGQHGTAWGNPQYVSGPTGYGMAMDFDGTGDYVALPIGSAIAQMTDITIACWADFSNVGGSYQRLWDFGTSEDNYMFVTPRIGNNGELRFAIETEEVAEINITAPATLPSGWHHVTVTIDSASMTMKLYQDGKLVAEGETSVLPSDLGETNQNYLGRSQFVADAYYDGSLDEFRIYDRALSHGEIRYLAGK